MCPGLASKWTSPCLNLLSAEITGVIYHRQLPVSFFKKGIKIAVCWWLMSVILVTPEVEIRRIPVQSHLRGNIWQECISKIPNTKQSS
jgi:hypothetical protein